MTDELRGRKVAFLAASRVEQVELTGAWDAVKNAGGTPVLVSPERESVQAFNHDVEKADTFAVDVPLGDATADDYDALVLPGGTTNPDKLRTVNDAVQFTLAFCSSGKPVAAICHGSWTLVEADVVRGKQLTSWLSLQTDIRNAGGEWHDEEVVVCREGGWTLVTSRKPDDLPAFTRELVNAFA
jgi:protease I